MLPAGQSADLSRFYRCIAELNRVVNQGVELSVLLETIVRETSRLLNAGSASIQVLDHHRQRPLLSATHGESPTEKLPEPSPYGSGEGLLGWITLNCTSVLVDDASADPRFVKFATQKSIRSLVAAPLIIQGDTIGMLSASHTERGWFNKDHETLLCFLANAIALDVENARRYRMAITDALTGLYNRQHLAERLKEEVDRAHRYNHPLTVLMLDIDDFKRINQTHSYPAGDRLLEQLGQRLLEVTREVDLVARYGGEEFVVLLPNTDREGGERAARRLQAALSEAPFWVQEHKLHLTVSAGGVVLNLREEPRDVLARADAALFQAKSEGQGRLVFNWLSFAGLS